MTRSAAATIIAGDDMGTGLTHEEFNRVSELLLQNPEIVTALRNAVGIVPPGRSIGELLLNLAAYVLEIEPFPSDQEQEETGEYALDSEEVGVYVDLIRYLRGEGWTLPDLVTPDEVVLTDPEVEDWTELVYPDEENPNEACSSLVFNHYYRQMLDDFDDSTGNILGRFIRRR